MLRGFFPLPPLLKKYNVEGFSEVVSAIRAGHIRNFNAALDHHQDKFLSKGIFLILEKLRYIVYRNLFRKVYLYNSKKDPKNSHLLNLSHLQAALRINGVEMCLDELECILANLIYQGSMKGYIAHKKCVVLSKKEPFPSNQAIVVS